MQLVTSIEWNWGIFLVSYTYQECKSNLHPFYEYMSHHLNSNGLGNLIEDINTITTKCLRSNCQNISDIYISPLAPLDPHPHPSTHDLRPLNWRNAQLNIFSWKVSSQWLLTGKACPERRREVRNIFDVQYSNIEYQSSLIFDIQSR